MWRIVLSLLTIAYLPGALIFRLPAADRPRRASLPAEERVFWSIVLSLAFSSVACLCLAAAGMRSVDLDHRCVQSAVPPAVARALGSRLRPHPGWTALLPWLSLSAAVSQLFVPPAEPSSAADPAFTQRVSRSPRAVARHNGSGCRSVPPAYQEALLSEEQRRRSQLPQQSLHGLLLLDPVSGTVVGQFPHTSRLDGDGGMDDG